jgi:hypothetical protein
MAMSLYAFCAEPGSRAHADKHYVERQVFSKAKFGVLSTDRKNPRFSQLA